MADTDKISDLWSQVEAEARKKERERFMQREKELEEQTEKAQQDLRMWKSGQKGARARELGLWNKLEEEEKRRWELEAQLKRQGGGSDTLSSGLSDASSYSDSSSDGDESEETASSVDSRRSAGSRNSGSTDTTISRADYDVAVEQLERAMNENVSLEAENSFLKSRIGSLQSRGVREQTIEEEEDEPQRSGDDGQGEGLERMSVLLAEEKSKNAALRERIRDLEEEQQLERPGPAASGVDSSLQDELRRALGSKSPDDAAAQFAAKCHAKLVECEKSKRDSMSKDEADRLRREVAHLRADRKRCEADLYRAVQEKVRALEMLDTQVQELVKMNDEEVLGLLRQVREEKGKSLFQIVLERAEELIKRKK